MSALAKMTQSFCKTAGKAQWIENVTSLSTMVLAAPAPVVVKTAWWVAWMYAAVPSRMPLPLLVETPYAVGVPTTETVPPYPAPAKSAGVPLFSSSFRYSLGARDVIGVSSYCGEPTLANAAPGSTARRAPNISSSAGREETAQSPSKAP